MPTPPKSRKSKPASSKPDQRKSVAHLVDTVQENLTHASRHASQLSRATTQGSKDHNREHMTKHLNIAKEHVKKITEHLKEHPAVAAEFKAIKNTKKSMGA